MSCLLFICALESDWLSCLDSQVCTCCMESTQCHVYLAFCVELFSEFVKVRFVTNWLDIHIYTFKTVSARDNTLGANQCSAVSLAPSFWCCTTGTLTKWFQKSGVARFAIFVPFITSHNENINHCVPYRTIPLRAIVVPLGTYCGQLYKLQLNFQESNI